MLVSMLEVQVCHPTVIKAATSWQEDFAVALFAVATLITPTAAVIKFTNMIVHRGKMTMLLMRIKTDYEEITGAPERAIMERYAMQSRTITTQYTVFITTLTSLYATIPFVPVLMDIVVPLNQTRKRKLLYEVDYLVDRERYYFPIILHEMFVTYLLIEMCIAVDTMFMVFVQHACGLFAVISYRMKYLHLIDKTFVKEEEADRLTETYAKYRYTETEIKEMCDKLKWGIKIHQKAIIYCRLLESCFVASMAIIIILNVIVISFQGFQIVFNGGNADDTTRYISYLMGTLNHLFFMCLPGQRLLNYQQKFQTDISGAVYYTYPKRAMTFYKFVLLRSTVYCKLTAGKLTTLGMETFLSVCQTAMSYFTVLSSMQ